MRNSTLIAIVAVGLATAGCGGSGNSASADPSAAVEVNLYAENFDTTIASDEAALNEAESRELNVATE